jgi:hypothetical protein
MPQTTAKPKSAAKPSPVLNLRGDVVIELKRMSNDPAYEAIFQFLATLERDKRETSFARTFRVVRQAGYPLKHDELAKFADKLQGLGLCEVVHGRVAKIDRIYWAQNPRSIANIALGNTTKYKPASTFQIVQEGADYKLVMPIKSSELQTLLEVLKVAK